MLGPCLLFICHNYQDMACNSWMLPFSTKTSVLPFILSTLAFQTCLPRRDLFSSHSTQGFHSRSGSSCSAPLPLQSCMLLSGRRARLIPNKLLLGRRLGRVFILGCFESNDLYRCV